MTEHRAPKENLAKSMLAGMSWQYVSIFSQGFLNLFVLATLSRLLAPTDFGVMGIAAIFVGLAELFSELGIGPAIIQHKDLTPKYMRVAFTMAVLLGSSLVIILWVAAPFIALFFHNSDVTTILRWVSFDFLLGSFGVVSEGMLRRKLQFRKLMMVNVAAYTFGYALIGITMAFSGFGVWALVAATLSQSFINSALLLIVERIPLKPSFARPELRSLVHYGGGITLARLFNYGASNGDYFVVGRFLGAGPLGIYTRAFRLMTLPGTYIGRALDSVLFPVMAKMQDELSRLAKTYFTGIALIGLLCAPTGVLMVILAPEIVNVVLGSKWSETILPFQILALGILPQVSYKIDNSLARALGAVYQRSVRDAIYAIVVIAGAWIGLHWGLWGVATGVLGSVILNDFLAFQMSLKLLNTSWLEYVKAQIPGLLLGLIVAVIAIPIRLLLISYGSSDLLTLILTTLVAGLSLMGFFLWNPQRLLGRYGTEALIMIFKAVPVRFFPRRVLRWYETMITDSTL